MSADVSRRANHCEESTSRGVEGSIDRRRVERVGRVGPPRATRGFFILNARSRRVEESKAFSTDGESDESDESDRRGATPRDCYKIGWVGLCRSDSSTRVSDESATPGRDSSDRRVAAARRVGATRPTSGTSTVGQVSRSRSDSGRRVDSSYTRPKSNVTRASEAATSRIDSDASWTWLIYAHSPPKARTSAGRQRWWWWWPHISNTSPSRPLR